MVYGNRYALFILRISLLSFSFLFFGLKIFHAKYYIQMNYCLYFNSWTGSHSNSSGSWNVQISEAQLNTFMFRLQRGTVFNKLFACHITMFCFFISEWRILLKERWPARRFGGNVNVWILYNRTADSQSVFRNSF